MANDKKENPDWGKDMDSAQVDAIRDSVVRELLSSVAQQGPGVPTGLRASAGGEVLSRAQSCNAAWRQIGWLGASGRVYTLQDAPSQYESVYSPLWVQVGHWVELEPAKYGIKD